MDNFLLSDSNRKIEIGKGNCSKGLLEFENYGRSRKISKTPFKVLDAPQLQDDFYLNLIDWGASNILGVGLGSCIYLWNAETSKVTKLYDLG